MPHEVDQQTLSVFMRRAVAVLAEIEAEWDLIARPVEFATSRCAPQALRGLPIRTEGFRNT